MDVRCVQNMNGVGLVVSWGFRRRRALAGILVESLNPIPLLATLRSKFEQSENNATFIYLRKMWFDKEV